MLNGSVFFSDNAAYQKLIIGTSHFKIQNLFFLSLLSSLLSSDDIKMYSARVIDKSVLSRKVWLDGWRWKQHSNNETIGPLFQDFLEAFSWSLKEGRC